LAFDVQEYEDSAISPYNGRIGNQIYLDVTQNLAPNLVNPNFGRPFMLVRGISDSTNTVDRESIRAAAFYRFDASEAMENTLGKIIGTHTFSGLFNRQEINRQGISYSLGISDTEADYDLQRDSARGQQISGFLRQNIQAIYLGPSIAGFNSIDDVPQLTGKTTVPTYQPGLTFTSRLIDNTRDRVRDVGLIVEEFLGGARRDREVITSTSLNLQSEWWDNKLTTIVGFRNDEAKGYRTSEAPIESDGTRDINKLTDPSEISNVQNSDIWSYSAVLHLSKIWNPFADVIEASIHYSQSENFQPAANSVDFFGITNAAPTGTTKDFGFSIYAPDGKFAIRVNFFKAEVSNSRLSNNQIGNIFSANLTNANFFLDGHDANNSNPKQYDPSVSWNTWQEVADFLVDSMPESTKRMLKLEDRSTLPSNRYRWTIPGNIEDLEDFTAEGTEIEIIYNPTSSWRIAANIARQESITSNRAVNATAYINTVLPSWESVYAFPLVPILPISEEFEIRRPNFYENRLIELNTTKSQEGKPSQEQAEWRVNVLTNYSFRDGSLSGANIGGAVRWEGKKAIGFATTQTPDGQLVFDVTNPFYADPTFYGDIWMGYKRALTDKIDWSIQLNLRNVLNEGELIPVKTQPDGSIARVRVAPPFNAVLSTTFSF
jgi:hypothetical protein